MDKLVDTFMRKSHTAVVHTTFFCGRFRDLFRIVRDEYCEYETRLEVLPVILELSWATQVAC